MKSKGVIIGFILVALVLAAPLCSMAGTPAVDLRRLSTEDDNWQVVIEEGDAGQGLYIAENNIWAMHFFHWLPTPDPKPDSLDEALVLDAVKQIWAEKAADFKVQSSGKGKIHGHKSFYVEGMRDEDSIWTRYTVFLCPKSNRLFISEMDIYQSLGTPATLIDHMDELERTISCHGVNRRISNPKVPMKMNFPLHNLMFFIPGGWRSDTFGEDGTVEKGHTWTLPAGSYQKVLYSTFPAAGKNAEAAAAAALETYVSSLTADRETREVESLPDGGGLPAEAKEGFTLNGNVLVKDPEFAWDSGKHVFRMRLWEKGGTWNCVLFSMLARDSFWEQRVYLDPGEDQFQSLEERLSKAIADYPAY